MGMSKGFLRLRLRNDTLDFNYRTQLKQLKWLPISKLSYAPERAAAGANSQLADHHRKFDNLRGQNRSYSLGETGDGERFG